MAYKKYEEIPEQYRFDLEALLGGKTIEDHLDKLKQFGNKLIELRDEQFDSAANFLNYKKHEEKFMLEFNLVQNYIYNRLSTNLVDEKNKSLEQKFEFQISQFYEQLGPVQNLFYDKLATIKKWKNDPSVAGFSKEIEDLIESKKYKLHDKVEEYLISAGYGSISLDQSFAILSDSETKFADAEDSKGFKHQVNDTSYRLLLKSQDATLRKNAYSSYYAGYLKHKETFANLWYQHVRYNSTQARVRGYNSLIEACLFPDRFPKEMLQNLFKSVQESAPLLTKYKNAHAKFFETSQGYAPKVWDKSLPLVQVKNRYTVEEAQELVLEAIKPLGKEYVSEIKKAFANRWVDYHNVPNKRSGAYSIGNSYGIERKYILMNFDYTINAVDTLAHELGHSMHSYYSDKHQDVFNSQYPIFLAEIASIFNELMLNDYLLSTSKDDKFKFQILTEMINNFQGTVHRQTLWAEYEHDVYNTIDAGQPIASYKGFEEIYEQVSARYRTSAKPKNIRDQKLSNIFSVIVPHFYYGYYVYKYAIGYIVANVFFQKYKKEGKSALDNYIKNFLSKGCSKWPVELLKDAGIDLGDPGIYKQAFDNLDSYIKQYIEVGNKIFKKK